MSRFDYDTFFANCISKPRMSADYALQRMERIAMANSSVEFQARLFVRRDDDAGVAFERIQTTVWVHAIQIPTHDDEQWVTEHLSAFTTCDLVYELLAACTPTPVVNDAHGLQFLFRGVLRGSGPDQNGKYDGDMEIAECAVRMHSLDEFRMLGMED